VHECTNRPLAIWRFVGGVSANWKIAIAGRFVSDGISRHVSASPRQGSRRAGDDVDRKSAGCAVSPVLLVSPRRSITSRCFLMVSARLARRPRIFDSIERKPTVSVTLRNFRGRDPPIADAKKSHGTALVSSLSERQQESAKCFPRSFDVWWVQRVALIARSQSCSLHQVANNKSRACPFADFAKRSHLVILVPRVRPLDVRPPSTPPKARKVPSMRWYYHHRLL